MNLHLSWDLFILVFFAVVVAYSFIIGRNQTLKVILGTYVAVLCADGLGNIFAKYLVTSKPFLRFLSLFYVSNEDQAIAFFKVIVFLVLIVMIAVRGMFQVESRDDAPVGLRFAILVFLGVLSGGLMISAVLVFISGSSLIGGSLIGSTPLVAAASGKNMLYDVYTSSRFIRIMLDYANFWFVLPGIFFIVVGLFQKKN